jgi:hypothetical protein
MDPGDWLRAKESAGEACEVVEVSYSGERLQAAQPPLPAEWSNSQIRSARVNLAVRWTCAVSATVLK